MVGRGGDWHGDMRWKPGECVRNTLGSGFPNPDAIASVMMHRGADVPAVDGMRSPCGSLVGLLVDEDFGARRCKGGAVLIEGAVYLGVG